MSSCSLFKWMFDSILFTDPAVPTLCTKALVTIVGKPAPNWGRQWSV